MNRRLLLLTSLLVPLPLAAIAAADRPDLLVADFEGKDYGAWTVEGKAFGSAPARGTLPGQMEVSGFLGKQLVNSYHEGDGTTGTLTSPALKIERAYLKFLIGGGGYAKKTCVNLLLDGRVVRTAVGPNTDPGGSEALYWISWGVKDLTGKSVKIQIVDQRTEGWGHINVDYIVQSDKKPPAVVRPGVHEKELTLDRHYLLFPIRNGARKARIDLIVGGERVRQFDAGLANTKEETSFWSFLDLTPFRGEKAKLEVNPASEEAFSLIRLSDEIPGSDRFYTEALRPQFHFSQKIGWNNDPNGLVYLDGEWHLYFQHNPYGWSWGNMHWGHAVSRDLVHWEQLPIAIYNHRRGDWAFSGGGCVDEHNTAGWQKGSQKVIVVSWTSTGRGECIAYSNDRGRTFTEYEGNPVIKHRGRDPKIVWYEPDHHWVLVCYDESKEYGRAIAFYASKDLKHWELQSRLKGYFECPELFELPVDGDASNSRWVIFSGDARYAVGRFDGKTFTPDHEGKHRVHYGAYYASQTFGNPPDGRRIQVGWARIGMPGMPFNQTFSFPHRLTLRTTPEGIRMFAEPVREIEKLHKKKYSARERRLSSDRAAEVEVAGELFDIRATFAIGSATRVGLDIGGNRVTYDVKAHKLDGAKLGPVEGKVQLQVLVDRPMIEVYGNRGRVHITSGRGKRGDVSSVKAFAEGGRAELSSLVAYELESIWKK